ncbi:MAG: rRNA pseudouridine synthase [Clostridia bacterium]|nr:rRNA pseudouridine synthase [Clostridia bacterium]
MERLQKYIAECGIASRRAAEELIKNGKVTVNGKLITEMGVSVDETKDAVKVNGKIIKKSNTKVYIMLNKPEGYVSTAKDQFDRPTVLDLIDYNKERIVPVGRLDYNSRGLLLLSNDGDFIYKMTHPKHHISKTYEVKVKGIPTDDQMARLRNGIILDGKKTEKAQVKIKRMLDKNSIIEIVIHEGRNRQVRRMCDKVGLTVVTLTRTKIGTLTLGLLKEGEHRSLRSEEIKRLQDLAN